MSGLRSLIDQKRRGRQAPIFYVARYLGGNGQARWAPTQPTLATWFLYQNTISKKKKSIYRNTIGEKLLHSDITIVHFDEFLMDRILTAIVSSTL